MNNIFDINCSTVRMYSNAKLFAHLCPPINIQADQLNGSRILYWTQVYLRSNLWVQTYVQYRQIDATLVEEDINSILAA